MWTWVLTQRSPEATSSPRHNFPLTCPPPNQSGRLRTCVSKACAHVLSHVPFFETPWTVALQAPLSMGFPRQEYCCRLPCSPPGVSPDPGIEPTSPALAGEFFPCLATGQALWPGLLAACFPSLRIQHGNSLVVRTLPSSAGVVGLIPGWGAKILHACGQKIKT